MMKEWSPKGTVVQMLNALSRVECDLPAAGIGQVKKRGRESVTPPFILPEKVIRAECINHSHWTKYVNRNFNCQN